MSLQIYTLYHLPAQCVRHDDRHRYERPQPEPGLLLQDRDERLVASARGPHGAQFGGKHVLVVVDGHGEGKGEGAVLGYPD